MAAAEIVYRFCFERGVRMTVTSRYAVPLLPMQLARSFAERHSCPVMTYLANAQSRGLEGLWAKLCDGKLPPRCTKVWYVLWSEWSALARWFARVRLILEISVFHVDCLSLQLVH